MTSLLFTLKGTLTPSLAFTASFTNIKLLSLSLARDIQIGKNMEMVPASFYGSLKRSWRRRGYQRISGSNRKNLKVTTLGGKKKRSWRIKVVPKLRFLKLLSPKKLFARLRDAYIDMMLNLAGNVGSLNGGNFFKAKSLPKPRQTKMFSAYENLDSRFVYEIYKALVASRELAGSSTEGVKT